MVRKILVDSGPCGDHESSMVRSIFSVKNVCLKCSNMFNMIDSKVRRYVLYQEITS